MLKASFRVLCCTSFQRKMSKIFLFSVHQVFKESISMEQLTFNPSPWNTKTIAPINFSFACKIFQIKHT